MEHAVILPVLIYMLSRIVVVFSNLGIVSLKNETILLIPRTQGWSIEENVLIKKDGARTCWVLFVYWLIFSMTEFQYSAKRRGESSGFIRLG